MNSADSPHYRLPSNVEGNEKPNAPKAYIRGLGAALEKWESLKERKSQRDNTKKEGKGQEIKDDADLDTSGKIILVNGNRIS
jgi:hypothetical protein